MLGGAWLAIRQAQEALKNGRFEEAHRLVGQPAAQGHKRAYELLLEVVRGLAARGERHLKANDPEAAWHDLLQAEQIDRHGRDAERLRQGLVKRGLAEVRANLEAGEPGRAADAAARLRERSVRQPELLLLDEAAKSWLLAIDQASRGEFAAALDVLDRVRRLVPGDAKALERYRGELANHRDAHADLVISLHEATGAARWRDVLELADKLLAVAPQHPEARLARARAWKAVEPMTVASRTPAPVVPTSVNGETPTRYLLWIDGVGGYLICLANRITLGQATPDGYVDVPLFADVSRLHAALTRDSEGYLLEAVRPVLVNAQPAEKALLRPNDRFTLGSSCQFQFRQPAPVSTSARLDLVSGQRLPVAVDAVLLMADTLLLGPGLAVHVSAPDLARSLVLYRHKDGLGLRCAGPFAVDGQKMTERAVLKPGSAVTGEDFSFTLEPLGMRMGRV